MADLRTDPSPPDPNPELTKLRDENERLRVALDQVTQDMCRILVTFFEKHPEFVEKPN